MANPSYTQLQAGIQQVDKATQAQRAATQRTNELYQQTSQEYKQTLQNNAVQADQAYNVMSEAQRNLAMQTEYPNVVNKVLSLFGQDEHNAKLQAARMQSAKIDLSRTMHQQDMAARLFQLDVSQIEQAQRTAAMDTQLAQQQVANYSTALDISLRQKAAMRQDQKDLLDGLSKEQLQEFQKDPTKAPKHVQQLLQSSPGLFEAELLQRQASDLQIMPQLSALALGKIPPAEIMAAKTPEQQRKLAEEFSVGGAQLSYRDIVAQQMNLQQDEQTLMTLAGQEQNLMESQLERMNTGTLGNLLQASAEQGAIDIPNASGQTTRVTTRQLQNAYNKSLQRSTEQALHTGNLAQVQNTSMSTVVSAIDKLAISTATLYGIPYEGMTQQDMAMLATDPTRMPASVQSVLTAIPAAAQAEIRGKLQNVLALQNATFMPGAQLVNETSTKMIGALSSAANDLTATIDKQIEQSVVDKPERTQKAIEAYVNKRQLTASGGVDIIMPMIRQEAPFRPGTPMESAWRVARKTLADKLGTININLDSEEGAAKFQQAVYAKILTGTGDIKEDNVVYEAIQQPEVTRAIGAQAKMIALRAGVTRLLSVGPTGPLEPGQYDTESPFFQIYQPNTRDFGRQFYNDNGALSIDKVYEHLADLDRQLAAQGQPAGYVEQLNAAMLSPQVHNTVMDELVQGQLEARSLGVIAFGTEQGFTSGVRSAIMATTTLGGRVAQQTVKDFQESQRERRVLFGIPESTATNYPADLL